MQDTTELDFTPMEHAKDYGPIGNHGGMGLLAHTLLALTPAGHVLGLAAQHCWARSLGPAFKNAETRGERQARKGKESEMWPVLAEAVGPVPEGLRWVTIGDRGSDSGDYWTRAKALGWVCLPRLLINRCVAGEDKLLTQARALPGQGSYPRKTTPHLKI